MHISKKIAIIFFNSFFVFICSFFLFRVLENPVILFDDITDFIISDFNFYHGRIISELIGVSIVKLIPKLLHINLQDFAIVSENLIKILLYSLTPLIFTSYILKINFKRKIFWGPIYFLFFAYIYILPNSSAGGNLMYSTLMFFCCYILPLPFFALLISKIYNIYVFNIDTTRKDSICLAVLSIFVLQANEMVGCISFVLLLCIYLEHVIKNLKLEKKDRKSFKLFPVLLSMIIANIIIYSSSGFKLMFKVYYDTSHTIFSFDNLINYIGICINKIILENWYIMIPLFIGLVAITCLKNKENSNILKLTLYTIIGIIILALALFCMGKQCYYAIGNTENYAPYWILYAPVAIVIHVCLLDLILLFIVYLFYKNNKILATFISLTLIAGCVYFMLDYKDIFNNKIYPDEQRRRQYIIDKMMVFYSKKNQTAILPNDNLIAHYSITERDKIYEVFLEADDKIYDEHFEFRTSKPFHILKFPKIYYINLFVPEFPYAEKMTKPEIQFVDNVQRFRLPIFQYINKTYGIETTSSITFKTEKEAISLFIKNGGTITEEELEKLKFSKIIE